ncbi:MAG: macro domain-containing protein [Armatimonadetes bacterium]|nr:macro domain-containing protein [Armatimonadota bacterium]
MSFEIILGDVNEELCHHWRQHFRDLRHPIHGRAEIQHGDFFDINADAYVSPANSHGIMDGGFDLLLRVRFPGVDVAVQREIDQLGGMLPIGHALVVETGDFDVPYLVSAPTMEVPMNIAHTNNVYLATRAVFRAVHEFNLENDGEIQSIAIPGLGTGVGKMPPAFAAAQMAEAYGEFLSEIQ